MATAVDAARIEIDSALVSIAPQLEGLLDFSRLNLVDASRQAIDPAIADYRRRVSLLTAAQLALASLVDDGYPDLAVRQISQQAFADLAANKATIDAALAQFTAESAASLNISAGAAEPKK